MATHRAICLPPQEGMQNLAQVVKGADLRKKGVTRIGVCQPRTCSGKFFLRISSAPCAPKPISPEIFHPSRHAVSQEGVLPAGPCACCEKQFFPWDESRDPLQVKRANVGLALHLSLLISGIISPSQLCSSIVGAANPVC